MQQSLSADMAKWCHSNSSIKMLTRLEYGVRGESCKMPEETVMNAGHSHRVTNN